MPPPVSPILLYPAGAGLRSRPNDTKNNAWFDLTGSGNLYYSVGFYYNQ